MSFAAQLFITAPFFHHTLDQHKSFLFIEIALGLKPKKKNLDCESYLFRCDVFFSHDIDIIFPPTCLCARCGFFFFLPPRSEGETVTDKRAFPIQFKRPFSVHFTPLLHKSSRKCWRRQCVRAHTVVCIPLLSRKKNGGCPHLAHNLGLAV